MNNIFREIKTMAYSKSVWIALAVMTILCLMQIRTSINFAGQDINAIEKIYDMVDGDMDVSELDKQIRDYYIVYSDYNSYNNAYAIAIGVGLLVFPVIASIYVGSEYTFGTIRLKAADSSLVKVIFSKIIVFSMLISVYLVVYGMCVRFCQKYWVKKYMHSEKIEAISDKLDVLDGVKMLLVTLMILLFYSLCAIIFTVYFRNAIAGIVITIAVNYISIPGKYSIFTVFKSLIVRTFRIYDLSCFNFEISKSMQLPSINEDVLVVGIYMIMIGGIIYFLSKLQRN